MARYRPLALLLAAGFSMAACSGSAVDTTVPATTIPTTTPTTTTAPTTSTTALPTVSIEGASPGLAGTVRTLYTWLADRNQPMPPGLPAGLAEALTGAPVSSGDVTGTASTGTVLGSEVAVVLAGEDVVLAVADQPDQWRVVGAALTGTPAWFGEAPRMALIIGSDARPGQDPLGYRADSLHIVTTVPDRGLGAIVGIPRDSWVETSYGGRNKITNVLASRGPAVVLETTRNVSGLPLEGYVVTGFSGFVGLVDAFGGFDFTVPFAMAEPKSQAYFQAGLQMFAGSDALAFARNRTISGGDFTRSYHQGLLMVAALRKVRDLGIGELPHLLEILTEFTWTDLSAEDLLTLGASSYLLDPDGLPNIVLDGRVGTAGSASVVFLTETATATFQDLADGLLTPAG